MPHTVSSWERSLLAALTLAGASPGAPASTEPVELERKRKPSPIELASPRTETGSPLARVTAGPATEAGRPAAHPPMRPTAAPGGDAAEGLSFGRPGPLGTTLTLVGGAAMLAWRRRTRSHPAD